MDTAAPSAPTLLPGQSAPLTVITATDQSGVVLIITSLCLIFAVISVFIRLFIRLQFRHDFAGDDYLCFGSVFAFIFQSSIVFLSVSRGFGKALEDIPDGQLRPMQKALYATDLLYIVVLWLTKCSVAFLFVRLSPDRGHNIMSYVIMAASTVFMIVSLFLIALRCNTAHPWLFINDKCYGLLARWEVAGALDAATEVALFAESVYLVKGLLLSFDKKFTVISAFAFRILIIAPLSFRLHYLSTSLSSTDPSLNGVLASVCTQTQLCYAIISTTIPCLRPFMAALSTNYGAPAAENKTTAYATGTSGSGKSGGSGNHNGTAGAKGEDGGWPLASYPKGEKVGSGSGSGSSSNSGGGGNGRVTSMTNGIAGAGSRPQAHEEPETRWDRRMEHHASVTGGREGMGRGAVNGSNGDGGYGDERSEASTESRRQIITKHTDWAVEYDGGRESGVGSRGSEREL